jgi:histidinol-phosphate aminotransferase
MKLPFRKELEGITAYKPGKPIEDVQREYGLKHVDKLASNENPLNCSPLAIEAVRKEAANLAIYPDGNATDLKKAIAEFYRVKETEIMPTSGSDEMVSLIAETFLNPGDEAIQADITFTSYIIAVKMMGATPVLVPLKNFRLDLNAMADAINEKTKVIWLCNPNNPTGTMFSEEELHAFMARVPDNVVVVYDEAYNEFVTDPSYPKESYKLYQKYPNMIVMRTFSKIYGLAALRVGYSFAQEEILQNINKIRKAFNVNRLAQVAAIAALKDQDFVKKTYELNKKGKEFFYKAFDEMGLTYAPTEANHIYVDVQKDCNEVFVELQKRGMIIRPITKTFIRITIGTMEQNERVVALLKEVLGK